MLKLFTSMFYLLFLNIIFVCPCVWCYVTNGLIWSKSQQEFISLYSLPWYAELRSELLLSSDTFIDNCNGEEIRVGYYQDANMINFYDNDTKVGGIFGDIWNLLANHLNFTLVPVKQVGHNIGLRLCNGTYTGLMGLIQDAKIHAIARSNSYLFQMDMLEYTVPVWRNRYRFYIRPEYKVDNKWIITLMAPDTWYCVFCFFLLLSLVGYMLQFTQSIFHKPPKADEQQEFSLLEHMFYTFSLLCAQGYIPSAFYNRLKLLSFTKTIFCWFILIGLSSHLIYKMTNRTLNPPFTDFQSLFNSTDYFVLNFKGSMVFDIFKKTVDAAAIDAGIVRIEDRLRYSATPADMYRRVCFGQKTYAMFEVDDRYKANGRFDCSLMEIGQSYFNSWAVLAVAKGFRYKKLFNEMIIKFWEFGILDTLTNRYLGLNQDKILKNNSFQTIDIDQVHLIFIILCCGIGLSVVIFLMEHMVFLSNKEQVRGTTIKV